MAAVVTRGRHHGDVDDGDPESGGEEEERTFSRFREQLCKKMLFLLIQRRILK